LHEIETARLHSIPIIVVVDADQQTPRQVIDTYAEKGFGWLFSEQVVTYSMQSREKSYELIISAIRRAVEHCKANDTSGAGSGIHDKAASFVETDFEERFKSLILSRYSSVHEAWNAFNVSGKGSLSRSDFKRVVSKTLGLQSVADADRKELRSKLDPLQTKRVTYDALLAFMSDNQQKGAPKEMGQTKDKLPLLPLPMDVPNLPDCYRPRENVEKQVKDKLLDHSARSRSCVTAQGMGGVGKSVITAAVVRHNEIRARFTGGIAWIGLSQQPNLLALQQGCYLQLTKEHMPKKRQSSVEEQHSCLSEALVSKTILVVIDDACE
jgi:hypothetical protein